MWKRILKIIPTILDNVLNFFTLVYEVSNSQGPSLSDVVFYVYKFVWHTYNGNSQTFNTTLLNLLTYYKTLVAYLFDCHWHWQYCFFKNPPVVYKILISLQFLPKVLNNPDFKIFLLTIIFSKRIFLLTKNLHLKIFSKILNFRRWSRIKIRLLEAGHNSIFGWVIEKKSRLYVKNFRKSTSFMKGLFTQCYLFRAHNCLNLDIDPKLGL